MQTYTAHTYDDDDGDDCAISTSELCEDLARGSRSNTLFEDIQRRWYE